MALVVNSFNTCSLGILDPNYVFFSCFNIWLVKSFQIWFVYVIEDLCEFTSFSVDFWPMDQKYMPCRFLIAFCASINPYTPTFATLVLGCIDAEVCKGDGTVLIEVLTILIEVR